MGFWQAVASGFSNYVTFSGRACRSEYWYWVLFIILCEIVTSIIDYTIGINLMTGIFGLVTLLPSLAVAVRRLHDIDRSGWWYLLMFVPLIGAVVLIVWWCKRGSKGYNRFGADRLPAEVSLHGAGRSLRRADSASN